MPDFSMSKLVDWMFDRIEKQRKTNSNWYAKKTIKASPTAKKRQRRQWMRTYRAKIRKELDDIMSWDAASFIAREKANKDKRRVTKLVKADKKKGIY